MTTQTKPCPKCGQKAGWWSPVTNLSMVFRDANGCKFDERIFEAKRYYCASCDSDIKKCVSET